MHIILQSKLCEISKLRISFQRLLIWHVSDPYSSVRKAPWATQHTIVNQGLK